MADRFFKYGFILSLISLVCFFISFVTPYWLEQNQYGDSKHKFIRCGLWQFCLNEWNFPQDYMGKNYTGCWYIFAREYDYVRQYMLPGWFIAVQFFMSLNFLVAGLACLVQMQYITGWFIAVQFFMSLNFLAAGLACLVQMQYITGSCYSPMFQKTSTFLSFATAVLIAICATTFGVRSRDRYWMPQPDRNYLSWSFAFCVLSGFFSVFSGMSLLVSCLRDHFFVEESKRRD